MTSTVRVKWVFCTIKNCPHVLLTCPTLGRKVYHRIIKQHKHHRALTYHRFDILSDLITGSEEFLKTALCEVIIGHHIWAQGLRSSWNNTMISGFGHQTRSDGLGFNSQDLLCVEVPSKLRIRYFLRSQSYICIWLWTSVISEKMCKCVCM